MLATLVLLEKPVGEVIIMGVEPATLELGVELSATVGSTVDMVVHEVISQLEIWQVAPGM